MAFLVLEAVLLPERVEEPVGAVERLTVGVWVRLRVGVTVRVEVRVYRRKRDGGEGGEMEGMGVLCRRRKNPSVNSKPKLSSLRYAHMRSNTHTNT